jgi:(2S)-methylsuccinyl-CoA dehydrogenase
MTSSADRPVDAPALLALARQTVSAVEAVLREATAAVRRRVANRGERLLDHEQRATHGLAWLATYVESIRQVYAYVERLSAAGDLGEMEELIVRIGLSEYLQQILGGIAMNQTEIVRPGELGLSTPELAQRLAGLIEALTRADEARRARLVAFMSAGARMSSGAHGIEETLASFGEEMRRFAETEIVPRAQIWHRTNSSIPLEVIGQLGKLGVFALTIPETWGGLGLSKQAMCVVAEELSRGYVGVGSLATRSDIAAELILDGGTEEQKRRWLPQIAAGDVLATAAFTEADSGSDLASLRTRAVRYGDVYQVYGSKTWITHAARADLMILLVRTNTDTSAHGGLSILLAEKPRGTDQQPFPAKGMSGSEIEVLGYRGLKEYEIAFDGFEVRTENLLGGVEGLGFKQLMRTFESSRIQTAARAIGIAQAALEHALAYALARRQFGKPIVSFPRVSDKIALMAAEIMIARQLTFFAARQKDCGRRCDLEAGMAKLLSARIAWAAADAAVQMHGGNGFALEFPVSRLLCDARVFSLFEGTAEIQAEVIARRLLEAAEP